MSFLEGLRKRFFGHLQVETPTDHSNEGSAQADFFDNRHLSDTQVSADLSSSHTASSLSGISPRSLQQENDSGVTASQTIESIPRQGAIHQQEAAKTNDNSMDHNHFSTTIISTERSSQSDQPYSDQQSELNGYEVVHQTIAQPHTQLTEQQPNHSTHLVPAPDPSSAIGVFLSQVELYIHQKDWKKALETCERVLELAPNTAEAYKLKGNILQRMGRPADAMGCYAEALVINPNYPEVHANLGVLHGTLDNWEHAVAFYEKAIALNPGFVGAYRHLAKAWEKLDRPENRLDTIYQALSLSPETFTANEHYEMGQHLLEKGQAVDAIECLRRAIELDPNHTNAHQMMAQALEQQGNWEEAVHHYNQALSFSAPSSQAEANLPPASLQETSQQSLVSSTASSPPPAPSSPNIIEQEALDVSVESLVALAQNYAQHGNWEKAITHYKNVLRLDPHNAHIYRELAEVFEQLGETDQALESRYRMLRLQPDWGTAKEYYSLGVALGQKGEVQKARECYSQAIHLDPKLSQAVESLAQPTIPITPTAIDSVEAASPNTNSMVRPLPSTATLPVDGGQSERSTVPLKGIPADNASQNKPQEAMVFHKQGETFANEKRWANAIAAYQTAIQHNPDFFWSHHNLGDALQAIEDWEGASRSYQQAIALGSDSAWSHYNLGNVLFKLDRWGEAAKAYQGALALNSNLAGVRIKIDQALKLQAQQNLERILNSRLGKNSN